MLAKEAFTLESTLHGVLHYEKDVVLDNTHPREHSCYGEVLLHTINIINENNYVIYFLPQEPHPGLTL